MGSTKSSQGKYLSGLAEGEKLGKGHHGDGPRTPENGPGPKKLGTMGRRDGATVHGKPTHGD
jgi:hypothetical protein